MKKNIKAYETTPYGLLETPDGWVVKQMWWDKEVSRKFTTRDEAEKELIKIAKENRAYRSFRI